MKSSNSQDARSEQLAAARDPERGTPWTALGLALAGLVALAIWWIYPRAEVEPVAADLAAARLPLSTTETLPPSASATRVPGSVGDSQEVPTPVPSEAAVLEQPEVRVEILDSLGRPAEGVAVAAFHLESGRALAAESTDRDGRATLALEIDGVSAAAELNLRASSISTAPLDVDFTLATLPLGPIRFTLIASGSVEVVLLGGDEFPIERGGECMLSFDMNRCPEVGSPSIGAAAWSAVDSHTIQFPNIGLNLCLTAQCWLSDLEFEDISFDGPRNPGDHVRVELPFVALKTRIQGRVLDLSGAPLSAFNIGASSAGQSPYARGELFTARSDEDGRFVVSLTADEVLGAGPRLEVEAAADGGLVHRGIVGWPNRRILESNRVAALDLGDVCVGSDKLLASGFLLDSRGKAPLPKQGVEFQLRSMDPDTDPAWKWVDASLGPDGSFSLGQSIPAHCFELRAIVDSCIRSGPVQAVCGNSGIRLILRDPCQIEGQLLLPDDLTADDFAIQIECTDTSEAERHLVDYTQTLGDGRFRTRTMLPGEYSIALNLDGHELARTLAVLPEAGSIARLEPIDLRGLIHPIHVTIVPAGGARLIDGYVTSVENLEGEYADSKRLTRDGTAVLASRSETIDLFVGMPGFLSKRFMGVQDGAELALERGIAISLELERPAHLPDGARVEFELQAHDARGECTSSVVVQVHADGKASATLPSREKYQISAGLWIKGTRERIDIAISRPTSIDVTGSAEPRVVVVAFAPASLEAALARLARD